MKFTRASASTVEGRRYRLRIELHPASADAIEIADELVTSRDHERAKPEPMAWNCSARKGARSCRLFLTRPEAEWLLEHLPRMLASGAT